MSLDVSDISYKYSKDDPVLQSVSLHVDDGELVALIGPSGCGKSTLLHCIAGLLDVDCGGISINGMSVVSVKPHERSIGIMMQDQPLYEHLSVEQNAGFPLQTRGAAKDTLAQKVEQTLVSLELSELAPRKVSQLSGGERRRVALARAIIVEPRVLLLDEPLVSLDEALRSTMRQFIRNVHDASNMSTLVVTHNAEEAMGLADRVIELQKNHP
jgi:ABC-type sugar transport system ATPase subunit